MRWTGQCKSCTVRDRTPSYVTSCSMPYLYFATRYGLRRPAMWIKRLFLRVVGGRPAPSGGTAPAHNPAYKAAQRSVVVSDATRAMLREGFRSNSSACERSTRPLMAIPVTHAAAPPVQAQRGNGQRSTPQSQSPTPSPAPPAKPRVSTGSAASTEPVLSGAAWTTSAPSVNCLLNPGDEATLLGAATTSEAPSPSAFGELPGTAGLDLSSAPPLSFPSADPPGMNILSGAPSWSRPETRGRD